MVKIDLITGFLGSGKTTFLKKYARYLMDKGLNICILENDYGAVNVDMMLLSPLEGLNCNLEMVAGGCDYDCHRRRFKTKLIAMGMCGYDRVLVEPSGIFDTDEFFDVLCEEPLDRWYEIGSVISIVDASLEESLSPESEYLLASEVANAGAVLLSKTQTVPADAVTGTVMHLNRAMERVQCKRRFDAEVITKNWDDLTDADFAAIARAGYVKQSFRKQPVHQENGYSSLYYMNLSLTEGDLRERVPQLLRDSACGHVIRVKGFLRGTDGSWLELNATRQSMELCPIEAGQQVIIVIGEQLNKDAIGAYFQVS